MHGAPGGSLSRERSRRGRANKQNDGRSAQDGTRRHESGRRESRGGRGTPG